MIMSNSVSYEVYVSPYDKTTITFDLENCLRGFKLIHYNLKRDIDTIVNNILSMFKIVKKKADEMVYNSCTSIMYNDISSITIITEHDHIYDSTKGDIYTLDIYATSLENPKELKIYRIKTENTQICNIIKNNFDSIHKKRNC